MKKATEQEFNSCSQRQTIVTVGSVASGIPNDHYVIMLCFKKTPNTHVLFVLSENQSSA